MNLFISDFSGLYGEVGYFLSFFLVYEISRIFSLRHLRGLGWTLTKKRTARVFLLLYIAMYPFSSFWEGWEFFSFFFFIEDILIMW